MTSKAAFSAAPTNSSRPSTSRGSAATPPRWTSSEASAEPACIAPMPEMRSEQRQPDPCERAIQAPSSSAAQSCSAPPNGTSTGLSGAKPTLLRPGARRRTARLPTTAATSPPSGLSPATSVRTRSTACSDASRTMSSPGDVDVNAATRTATPRPSAHLARRAARSHGSAHGDRPTTRLRDDQLPRGERRRERLGQRDQWVRQPVFVSRDDDRVRRLRRLLRALDAFGRSLRRQLQGRILVQDRLARAAAAAGSARGPTRREALPPAR